eukprot:1257840-Pleurochrysis_carterae.AAC.1
MNRGGSERWEGGESDFALRFSFRGPAAGCGRASKRAHAPFGSNGGHGRAEWRGGGGWINARASKEKASRARRGIRKRSDREEAAAQARAARTTWTAVRACRACRAVGARSRALRAGECGCALRAAAFAPGWECLRARSACAAAPKRRGRGCSVRERAARRAAAPAIKDTGARKFRGGEGFGSGRSRGMGRAGGEGGSGRRSEAGGSGVRFWEIGGMQRGELGIGPWESGGRVGQSCQREVHAPDEKHDDVESVWAEGITCREPLLSRRPL